MFLVIVDAHSKWMDVYPTRSSDSLITIEKLRASFACWGVPTVLVTDYAQCFVSQQFKTFCSVNGIRHLTTPSLSPKSNGLAERSVQSFKNGLYKQISGSIETKVSRFLFRYRTTPHTTTSCTPAELFLGRVPRTHLDGVLPDRQERIRRQQEAQKTYRDRNARERCLNPGDPVYVPAVDRLQGLERCRWAPGRVVFVEGVKVTVELNDGRVIVRHADQVRERYSAVLHVANDPLRSRVTPIPAPDPVTESAAASARHAPVPGQLASTPDRLPAPDRAPAPGRPPVPVPPGLNGAVSAPGVTTVPPSAPSPSAPRYRLRDRSTLRPPDRYVASYE